MIDAGQRRRRKMLGWALLAAALGMLVVLAFGRVVLDRMLLGTIADPAALGVGLILVFLALAGTGAYLLRTVWGR